MTEDSQALKGLRRLQLGFVAKYSLLLLPLILLLYFYLNTFTPRLKELTFRLAEDAISPKLQTYHDRLLTIVWITFTSSILLALAIWLAAIVQRKAAYDTRRRILTGFVLVTYAVTAYFWALTSIYIHGLAFNFKFDVDVYAAKAGYLGILPVEGTAADDGVTRVLVKGDLKASHKNWLRFRDIDRMIGSESTPPMVARHLIGSLMVMLKELDAAKISWTELRDNYYLSNECVQTISRLSGREFSKPVVVGSVLHIDASQAPGLEGWGGTRVIPSFDAQRKSNAELLEWWPTVADKPEWEPIPPFWLKDSMF